MSRPIAGIGNVTPAVDLPPISAALSAYACSSAREYGKWGSNIKDVTAETDEKTAEKAAEAAKLSSTRTELNRRYGQIGISAVAAAARYQGAAKNPAYAPVPVRSIDPPDEAA
jgi:hypothetical protein